MESSAEEQPMAAQPAPPASKSRFRFRGTGLDYFLLNVVNFRLTVVTLGLATVLGYTRWRKNLWFVENAALDGRPFVYHAR